MGVQANLDQIFEKALTQGKTIYKNKEALELKWTPPRLIGRDRELEALGQHVSRMIDTQRNISILGTIGCGKTVCVKYVLPRFEKKAQAFGKKVKTIYISCHDVPSTSDILAYILNRLKKPDERKIPNRGWYQAMYVEKLESYAERFDAVIICLDEVDIPVERGYDGVIRTIVETPNTSLVTISNKPNWYEKLDPRIESRLQLRELHFDSYDVPALYSILEDRARIAFKDGIIKFPPGGGQHEGLFNIAKICYDVAGDARSAIELLRASGELLEQGYDTDITPKLIEKARKEVEVAGFVKQIGGLALHQKFLLYAICELAKLAKPTSGKMYVPLSKALQLYKSIAAKKGKEILTDRRLRTYLDQFEMYGFIERKTISEGGRKGRPTYIKPLFDVKKCLEALEES
ncbi:MAG: AAA family ATPase [Deltaproteobacteria bacterium]|nr:AAA family ATPase [Deltaproteobacteria bacterium]